MRAGGGVHSRAMATPPPGAGALTREGLFRMVTDEVFRDGRVDPDEQKVLQVVSRFLKLDPARAGEISRGSKKAYQAGALEGGGALDPARLYRRILAAVLADGEVDDLEAKMLLGLRQVLGIDLEAHEALEAALRDAPAPAPEPEPLEPEEVERLSRRAHELARDTDPGTADADTQEEAARILTRLAVSLPLPPELGTRVAGTCVNLAALLGAGDRLDELAAFLARSTRVEGIWKTRVEAYRMAFENALQARLAARPAAAFEVVALAERLALAEPVEGYRLAGWVAALRILASASISRGEWDRHAILVEGLDRIPPGHLAEVGGLVAGVLADRVILGLHHGREDAVLAGLRHLGSLDSLMRDVDARREHVQAAAALVEVVATSAERGAPPPVRDLEVLRRAHETLRSLAARPGSDRATLESLASVAGFAMLNLLALGDDADTLAFVRTMQEISSHAPGDVEIQFSLAKAVVNSAIIVRDRAPPPADPGLLGKVAGIFGAGPAKPETPILDALEETLGLLVERAPGAAPILDACERFARVTGRRVAHAPAPESPARADRHGIPAGWKDEAPGWPDGVSQRFGFPRPEDAVDAVEDGFGAFEDALARGDEARAGAALQQIGNALQALYILDTEMGLRQRSYGRLARILAGQLEAAPALLGSGMLSMRLHHLAEDLGDSGNPALEEEGRALGRAIEEARRRS